MEKVHISKCEGYELDTVKNAVYECLDSFEAFNKKLTKGARVLVKANLLMKKSPDEATTTHPAVVEAIVRYLQDRGCEAIIGDSPAGPYTVKSLQSIYKATGMEEVAERTGCELNYNVETMEIWDEKLKLLKGMKVISIAKAVDLVISAAKLKTHGMMTYTGAVKNLFGVIPGLIKAEYHFKMSTVENFAEHLIDICEYIMPAFSIIDAVEAMEGNGPSAGDKRHVGLVLASDNPYAVDAAAAGLMGIKPMSVPTIMAAAKRELFCGDVNTISFTGTPYKSIKLQPFKLPDSISINFIGGRVPKFVERLVTNTFRPSPIFDFSKCISCGHCKRSCPPDVIDMTSGKPVVNLDKCIRCFCCHELCPEKAVDIKKHWLHERIFK